MPELVVRPPYATERSWCDLCDGGEWSHGCSCRPCRVKDCTWKEITSDGFCGEHRALSEDPHYA